MHIIYEDECERDKCCATETCAAFRMQLALRIRSVCEYEGWKLLLIACTSQLLLAKTETGMAACLA